MSKRTRNVALGTLVAAAAGYVAGVLTAPKSGRETRRDIQDAATRAKMEAEKNLKQLHSELGRVITTGKSKAKSAKTATKKELTEALASAQLAKEKARVILSAVHEGDADDKDLKKAITESKKAVEHLKKYIGKPRANSKAQASK
jgi:gas vesicle protein